MENYNNLIGKKCYFIKNKSRPTPYYVYDILDSLQLVEDTIKSVEINKDGVFILFEKWDERFNLKCISFTPKQAFDKFKDIIEQIYAKDIELAHSKYTSNLEELNKLIEKGSK